MPKEKKEKEKQGSSTPYEKEVQYDFVLEGPGVADAILFDDTDYRVLMDEVKALPEKKQKKWKGSMYVKNGQKMKVFYKKGILWTSQFGKWKPIIPKSEAFQTVNEGKAVFSTGSDFAEDTLKRAVMSPDGIKQAVTEKMCETRMNSKDHSDPRKSGKGKHSETTYAYGEKRKREDEE